LAGLRVAKELDMEAPTPPETKPNNAGERQ